MKAIVQKGYGSADTLELRDIEIPTPGDNGVLVEVHAASVNALDWHVARGVPFFIPILEAISSPKHRVRGVDLAGLVAAVGKNVTRFKPGDAVLGGAEGSFAEFTVTTEKQLAPKPPGITFEQAATLNVAGLTARRAARARQRRRRRCRNIRRADRKVARRARDRGDARRKCRHGSLPRCR
jgi:NADPH:quinone reductase-like Zn-dependent oxidoreductase